jgi:hypothetical protein
LKTTTKDINIYKFGNEHNFISINILETWRISEQSLLLRYEPIFEYYLRWVIDESPNALDALIQTNPEKVRQLNAAYAAKK